MEVKMQNKWSFVHYALLGVLILLTHGCKKNNPTGNPVADLLLHNAFIYPVSIAPIENGAMVIREGKIIAIGQSGEILTQWKDQSREIMDCEGAFLMPGFIEGHGHFSGLGYRLLRLDLLDTRNWQEMVDSVAVAVNRTKPGEWITGGGWHQEKWNIPLVKNINGYPYHDLLSKVSPNNPVMLSHASGHSLLVNEAAMKAAGITTETADPPGGHIVRDGTGTALGVFEENAMNIIQAAYTEYLADLSENEKRSEWFRAIQKAQQHCLAYGITSFQDAGSKFFEIERYTNLAKHDSLDLRLWVMLRHPLNELDSRLDDFPILGAGQDMFTCRALKSEVDGALGSFGAWLLVPYADNPGYRGLNTTSIQDVKAIAALAYEHGMQMCVHAIGDRANREVLDIYQQFLSGHADSLDLRWRIEHAQHLNPADMPRFKEMAVIASMQGIHCTSDAPFVVKRLGEERAREGAYAWRSLLDLGVKIANGTDAPVERVDPLPSLYASVTRKRIDNGQVFFNEQAMTREEALYSYTLGNAYAGFEEDRKGSLEPGKWADIILLTQNLLTCPDDSIPVAKVLLTVVGGEIKYQYKW